MASDTSSLLLQRPVEVPTIWAGHRLAAALDADEPIGTLWTLSRHPHAMTTVGGGPMDGLTLAEAIDETPDALLGGHEMLHGGYIDADEFLSVQVHPDPEYAREHEGDNGKTETWYVIACEPGATLVAGTTAETKEELREHVENGTVGDLLIHHEVHPGDVIHVPYGTLHCIGAGIFCAELSMDSDTTYRFFDWNRTDRFGNPRELHLDKSLDVVQLENQPQIVHVPETGESRVTVAVKDPDYDTLVIDVHGALPYDHQGRPAALMVVAGSGTAECDGETIELGPLGTAMLAAAAGPVTLRGDMRLFVAEGK